MDAAFKAELEEMGMDVDTTVNRFMGNEGLYLKFLNKFQNFCRTEKVISTGQWFSPVWQFWFVLGQLGR